MSGSQSDAQSEAAMAWAAAHAQPPPDALYNAAGAGDRAAVGRLLRGQRTHGSGGIDVDWHNPVEENRTALMWAAACAAEGDAAAVTRLLTAAGADVNLQDSSQRTALHWACYMGHAAAVEALLAGGECDLSTADDEGRTALDLAREKNETRCAELLELAAGSRRPTLTESITPAIARASGLFAGRWATSPGRLFAWGKAGGKGGNALPVAADRIDRSGDCCFPAPCRVVPSRTQAFVKASVGACKVPCARARVEAR
eukprot:SAG22_NODE_50_length_24611_cov_74.139687_12_plen_257_part_00